MSMYLGSRDPPCTLPVVLCVVLQHSHNESKAKATSLYLPNLQVCDLKGQGEENRRIKTLFFITQSLFQDWLVCITARDLCGEGAFLGMEEILGLSSHLPRSQKGRNLSGCSMWIKIKRHMFDSCLYCECCLVLHEIGVQVLTHSRNNTQSVFLLPCIFRGTYPEASVSIQSLSVPSCKNKSKYKYGKKTHEFAQVIAD